MTSTNTIDLHDLLTVMMRERLLTEPRFMHARLVEINDGSTPRTFIPADVPLAVDTLPTHIPHIAYFLSDEGNQQDEAPIEPATFIHETLQHSPPIPYPDLELHFWRIRHHNSGYLLTHALQLVLDALPADTTLRIRTSRGYTLHTSANDFTIAEAPLKPSSTMYVCKLTKRPEVNPALVAISQYLTGNEGDVPWVYLLLGGSVAASWDRNRDGRVAVDLVSPLIGLRGLGGEVFVMEKLVDAQDILPIPWEPEELVLSGRLTPWPPQRQEADEARALSERVLKRLEKIWGGEEIFCGYCGKDTPTSQCGGCKKAKFCDVECQRMGWKYHKRWCKADRQN